VVPTLATSPGKSPTTRKLVAELKVALDQRKRINSQPVRRLLSRRIRDLKAELVVFGCW